MSARGNMRGLRGGSAVTIAGQMANILISLASVVILARLLDPTDFGLVAMVGVVSTLGTILRDLGLSVATLKAPTLSNQLASNAFWLNVTMSGMATALIAASGTLLATIYQEPRLVTITPFLAFTTLLGGLQAQIQVQLSRAKRFGAQALISVSSAFVGLCVAIACALLGFGYWSLVAQTLTVSFIELILKAMVARWRPLRPRRAEGSGELMKSGFELTGTTVVNYFADNAATFSVGVNMNAADVGIFGKADQLIRMPLKLVIPLVRVVLPTLNETRSKGGDIEKALLRVQGMVGVAFAMLIVPLAASAPALFPFVLGSEWEASGHAAVFLAVGGIALALGQVNYWAFLLEAGSRRLLQFNLVAKPLSAVVIVAGSFFSVNATAVGSSIGLSLIWVLGVLWLKRSCGFGGRTYLVNGAVTLGSAACGILAGTLTTTLVQGNLALEILVPMCVSLAVMLGVCSLSPTGRRELRDIMHTILRRRG